MVAWVIGAALGAPLDGALDAVVLVRQGSTSCAGVHLGGGAIATAYHCVAPGGRPSVRSRRGEITVGRVRAVDAGDDLALIDAPGASAWAHLDVAEVPPAVGTPVWALGHPLGDDPPVGLLAGTLRWSAADGIVAAVGSRALQTTAPVNPGNSGGPLVDAEGRVVGIVSRRLGNEGLGFAVRADTSLAELRRVERHWPVIGGTLALGLVGLSQTGGDGSFAVGGRAELALRDRLLVEVSAYVPVSARWTAAQLGSTASAIGEATGGLRQRIARGSWAVRLDAVGGVAMIERWSAAPADPLDLSTTITPTWTVSGAIHVRNAGLELGAAPAEGMARAAVVLRWPGVVAAW